MSNTPQNIKLFDLNSSSSQTFVISLKDPYYLPVSNAIIDISRKYVGEGVFKSVEVPLTDSEGQTKAHLSLEGAVYNIVVSKYGQILGVFSNVVPYCNNLLTSECEIPLYLPIETGGFVDYQNPNGISNSITFDLPTRTMYASFSTLDGSVAEVTLNITALGVKENNTLICSDTLTTSSGTLSCIIPPSYYNTTLATRLIANGEVIKTEIHTIPYNIKQYIGKGNALFFNIFLFLTIVFMFAYSTIGLIIGVIIGFIISGIMFATIGGNLLTGSSVLVWVIITGGIILYKIFNKE